jgi:hypothetical protein
MNQKHIFEFLALNRQEIETEELCAERLEGPPQKA